VDTVTLDLATCMPEHVEVEHCAAHINMVAQEFTLGSCLAHFFFLLTFCVLSVVIFLFFKIFHDNLKVIFPIFILFCI
jgi:hypothetical protein